MADTTADQQLSDDELGVMSLRDHLLELRSRMTIAAIAVLVCSFILWPFKDTVFAILQMPLSDAVAGDGDHLYKAEAIVGYAKALIVIAWLFEHGDREGAFDVADNMVDWLLLAARQLDDPEVMEVAGLMQRYASTLHSLM